MAKLNAVHSKKHTQLPIQKLLGGEYLRVIRLHKNLNDLSVIPHRHDHYELMLIKEGEGIHTIDFNTFNIKPLRLFFLHPGQVHLIDHFDRDGWLILFGEDLFKRFLKIHPQEEERGLLDSYTDQPYIDLDDHLAGLSDFIINQLQTELSVTQPDPDIILHYISLLLLHFNNAHQLQHPPAEPALINRAVFYQLKQLIEKHFREQHSAGFYAATMRMDIKKLNSICRASTGLTVFELLQSRLITECKILLRTSASSVKEISYKLGFNDPAFFGRFFRKHMGMTPAAFRNTKLI